MGTKTPIRAKLIIFFKDNPDRQFFVEQIMAHLGETNRTRIFGGMQNLITSGQLPGLRRVQLGGPWVYEPDSVMTTSQNNQETVTFERVAEDKEGNLFLRGSNGGFYRATRL